jgi:predicted NAD/FAD-binding protein
VRRLVDALPDVRCATPVRRVVRGPSDATVVDARGQATRVDEVVLATHADTALAILGDDATHDERRLLGAFPYQRNVAVLHRDPAFMPRRRRAWSSWNYLADARGGAGRHVSLTYWMNLLQGLDTERPVFVTLNPATTPRDAVSTFVYHHPAYDGAAIAAQAALPTIQGRRRAWFCGSYTGFGFHEDALRSGLEVARALGSPAPWHDADAPGHRDGVRERPLAGVGT